MLELDLILQPFTESYYDLLEESDQLRFQELLELEDQDLYLWLMNREVAVDPDIKRIVQIIRDSRKPAGTI
jgi:antitoxin CptB